VMGPDEYHDGYPDTPGIWSQVSHSGISRLTMLMQVVGRQLAGRDDPHVPLVGDPAPAVAADVAGHRGTELTAG